MYIRREIRLGDIPEVYEFVTLTDACDFEVNIGYDRVKIDAKSIVGVMGLNLARPLLVEYEGESSKLEKFLDEHPFVR